MSYQDSLKDYVDVAERISIFREKYPTGCLQPANLDEPLKVLTIDGKAYVLYTACAYRTPDDPRPGVGIAWELVPGATSFTRGSEAMNAETAAWGRAIVAVLAADTKRGVASAQEVNNRIVGNEHLTKFLTQIDSAKNESTLKTISVDISSAKDQNLLTENQIKLLQKAWVEKQKSLQTATPTPPSFNELNLPTESIPAEDVAKKIEEIQEQMNI
jgi:hypothetical protein